MAAFLPCVEFTMRPENEGAYVDNPADPGGPTNFGITLAGLQAWRGNACSVADVKALSASEAQEIYHANYWQVVAGSSLPAGIDLMVFDFGVNHGPGSAVRMLQRILGTEQDGDAGPDTVRRASCAGAVLRARIAALSAAQQAFYAGLHNETFAKGWLARTVRRQAAAMVLAAPPTPKKAVSQPAAQLSPMQHAST